MLWSILSENSKLSKTNAMDKYQSIEDKLNGLLPPSISEQGQARMEDTIDQLAALETAKIAQITKAAESDNGPWPSSGSWKAAAALALLVVPVMMFFNKEESSPSVARLDSGGETANLSELVVLSSVNRIDGREDDGLIIPENGSSPHYRYRYRVTDEEQVRDDETGTVITLRQPRQEIVTIPVTQF